MTIGEDRDKDQLPTESFSVFQRSRFLTTEQWSSRKCAFDLTIRTSISFFRLLSLVNTTPTYLNFSRCWAFPLTCSIHCFIFMEKHTVISRSFYCWFSFRLGSTQQKTYQVNVNDLVQRMQSAPNRLRKTNCCSCSSQQWNPRRHGCDC